MALTIPSRLAHVSDQIRFAFYHEASESGKTWGLQLGLTLNPDGWRVWRRARPVSAWKHPSLPVEAFEKPHYEPHLVYRGEGHEMRIKQAAALPRFCVASTCTLGTCERASLFSSATVKHHISIFCLYC